MYIVLLRGYSHSGKDYIGNILCNNHGFTRFAFADSLKSIVADSFGYPVEQLHSQNGKLRVCETDEKKRTFRQILIDEALRLRDIDSGIFAKYCSLEIIKSGAQKVVITDWRYPNEIEILQKSFPRSRIIPVHIIRPDQTCSPVNDISEYQFVNRITDYTIINTMTTEIHRQIDTFVKLNIIE